MLYGGFTCISVILTMPWSCNDSIYFILLQLIATGSLIWPKMKFWFFTRISYHLFECYERYNNTVAFKHKMNVKPNRFKWWISTSIRHL